MTRPLTEAEREYLRALVDVGKRHGFSLAHEDGHGSFLVESREDGVRYNDERLMQAAVIFRKETE